MIDPIAPTCSCGASRRLVREGSHGHHRLLVCERGHHVLFEADVRWDVAELMLDEPLAMHLKAMAPERFERALADVCLTGPRSLAAEENRRRLRIA